MDEGIRNPKSSRTATPGYREVLVRDAGIAAIYENAVRPSVVNRLMVDPRQRPGRGRSLQPTRCSAGAWLCHRRTVRLTLAGEPCRSCQDLAEAWSAPSQLSSVVLT